MSANGASGDGGQAGGEQPPQDGHGRAIDRRTLLKGALVAGGTLLGGGVALADLAHEAPRKKSVAAGHRGTPHDHAAAQPHGVAGSGSDAPASPPPQHHNRRAPGPYTRQPNILFVMVDQLRTPRWFSDVTMTSALTPNIARLQKDAVSFQSHYTASNDCSPARAALLTGLYTHQTGCMITGGSTLSPRFPTWGSMLRELGYSTWWYGKWHLTHGDNRWSLPADAGALERYGFGGGTYPSPDGGPGQGWRADPAIAKQFKRWIKSSHARSPWCTTVSFVNPHDIAWWYRWSDQFTHEAHAQERASALPPNFETPEQLQSRRKPRLQLSFVETTTDSFGHAPYTGPKVTEAWLPFLDLYLKLVRQVDVHIGEVLNALYSRPSIAENTIVVFTSDHGEYGASHGLRGKGGSVYDEALHVPLLVKDLRDRKLTRAPRVPRRGLTSSVDVAPLLLDLATGSSSWRRDSHFSQIAHRHDLLKMLSSPSAPGREYVLHATDEIVTEFAARLYAADAPLHVTALRSQHGKVALYSDWKHRSIEPHQRRQEGELYAYDTEAGRLELDNTFGEGSALQARLLPKLLRATRLELHERLPQRLHAAQREGFHDYYHRASKSAVTATERRSRLLERMEEGKPLGGGLRTMLERQRDGYISIQS
ncbi:MAG: sulfatase-like hydrolase/transferase [Solirubrobacteraceae bacterium]